MKKMQKLVILALVCLGTTVYGQSIPSAVSSGNTAGRDESAQFEEVQHRQSIGGTVEGGRSGTISTAHGPLSGAERIAFLNSNTASVESSNAISSTPITTVSAESFVGQAPWSFFDLRAGTNETIALSDTIVIVRSSDNNNVLGETNSFGSGTTYTTSAFVIREDGSKVTSGAANATGKRLVFAVATKHFTAPLQEVRNYLNSYPGWFYTIEVWVKGNLLATAKYYKAQPVLGVVRQGNNLIITAAQNGDPNTYPIQKSAKVGPGSVWTSAGTIRAGQSLTNSLIINTAPAGFIRYAP